MTEQKEVTAYEGPKDLVVTDTSNNANLLDTARFNHLWRLAQVFSQSKLVPDIFVNDPASCFVALQMALRVGVDPLMFLQKSYVIKGKPSIEATLAIALLNTSGLLEGKIEYTWSGKEKAEDWTCTASAKFKNATAPVTMEVSWQTVKDSGWANNTGWKAHPKLMFQYRTAMWLIRVHCPEVILGMYSVDELQDMGETVEVSGEYVKAQTQAIDTTAAEISDALDGDPTEDEKAAILAAENEEGHGK